MITDEERTLLDAYLVLCTRDDDIEREKQQIEAAYDNLQWWKRFINYCHTGK